MLKDFIYHFFECIDSTNKYLKTLPLDDQIHVCQANMQTHGRGRFQRNWESPKSENIYLSIRYPCTNINTLNGLSLVISLSILRGLSAYGINIPIGIKWPNDLLWENKKLAGILIEIIPGAVIIGIGLNIDQNPPNGCSLETIVQYNAKPISLNKNNLTQIILKQIHADFYLFQQQGFIAFRDEWVTHHVYHQQKVTISQQNNLPIHGIIKDINPLGHLILQDANGIEHCITSGEASFSSSNNTLLKTPH